MKKLNFIWILILGLAFTQCEDNCNCNDKPEVLYGKVNLNYKLKANNNIYNLKEIVALDGMNEFKLEKFKFYLDNFSALSTAGSKNVFNVALIDFENPNLKSFTYNIPVGVYSAFNFGVGLDEKHNQSDPAAFEMDEPLSSANDMYWSWAMKYKFATLEGRANQNDAIGQPSDILMSYHPGADALYTLKKSNISFDVLENQTINITVYIDLNVLFESGSGGAIDIPTEKQTHTTPADYKIAEKFFQNFSESFSFEIE